MKLKLIIFVFIALYLNTQVALAAENDYGIVQAWFNDKNATVEGLSMKIGEPGTIKVTITSKIEGNVHVKLMEPGVTKAFEVISGQSKQDERIDNMGVSQGWSKTFIWEVRPNGAWKNGNAPINIFVSFYNSNKKVQKPIEFTIANPFILDEQYPGYSPVQTTGATQPSPTGTSSKPQQAPFLAAFVVLAVILGVWIVKKGNR
ncbi:MAG: sarcinarray family MAST domain-containing protein [Candidatus Methanoperedens sp.]|nr:sarcinarray family MAST domain-containing protein [Candidatus Methanoperedens sp.]